MKSKVNKKALFNKHNKDIANTLEENTIIKGVFSTEFLNKYSFLKVALRFFIPLSIIVAICYLIFNYAFNLHVFIGVSLPVIGIYIGLYFINFNRIFYWLNWVLIKRKRLKKLSKKQQIEIQEGLVSFNKVENTNQSYLSFSIKNKNLLEHKINQTFNAINDSLSLIHIPYQIISDKQGIHFYAKNLEEVQKAFNDNSLVELTYAPNYQPRIDLNSTNLNEWEWKYRSFIINNSTYKFAFFNINKISQATNINDISNFEGVIQAMIFAKPFSLDTKKKNAINENILALNEQLEKSNAVKSISAANDLRHTIGVLSNLMDDKTAVSSATLMVIYEDKSANKNLIKELINRFKLTRDKEYYQAYTLIKNLQNETFFSNQVVFNEVSCFNLSSLLLTNYHSDMLPHTVLQDKFEDLLIGAYDGDKKFYFNNLLIAEDENKLVKGKIWAPNRNGIVVGTSGGGKSYFMNELIKYNNANGIKGILIDPNNQIKSFGEDKTLNQFDITNTKLNIFVLNENEKLEDKINFLMTIFNHINTIPSEVLRNLIQSDLKKFYLQFKDNLAKQSLKEYITYISEREEQEYFQQVSIILKGNEKLANIFVEDAEKLIFSGSNLLFPVQEYTKINKTNEDKIMLFVMWYLVDNFIFEEFNKGNYTMLYVDEAQNFFSPEYLPILDKMARELRKFKSGIWFFTQTFSKLVDKSLGSAITDIFANCAHKFIFKQDAGQIQIVIDNYLFGEYLTKDNKVLKEVLNNLEQGQCVYISDDIYYIDKKYKWEGETVND